jgi:polysaccharide pyruvyl transferase WcaK-like protein
MKKIVLFAGAYGIENAGDDLPLIVMCDQLRKLLPDTDIEFRALSRHPNSWEEKTYGVKMIKNIEYESRDQARGKWFRGLNPGDDSGPVQQISDEIKKSDLIIFGAGNFLIDITIDTLSGPIPLFSLYIFLAKLYHKPVMLYGLSAGPLRTEWGRDLTKWIVENADITTVRDVYSKKLLEKMCGAAKTIHLLPDPTIGAQPQDSDNIENIISKEGLKIGRDKKTIAIGLRNVYDILSAKKAERVLGELAGCLNRIKAQTTFIFIPQSTYKEDDDRLTARQFTKLLDADTDWQIIENRYDPRELIGLYGLCDLTLAIRLHAAVFSSIAGTPTIAINYLPKVEGFMKSIGLNDFCINVDDVKQDDLLALFEQIWNNKKSITHQIELEIEKKREAVNRYGSLAADYL